MSEVVYVSRSHIERREGSRPDRYMPGEANPVVYSVYGAVAEHYKIDRAKLKESHASTIPGRTQRESRSRERTSKAIM